MSSFDPGLREQLDHLVPVTEVTDDWQTIVRTARKRLRRRRFIELATVAALLVLGVSPVGATIAGGVADFSAWLRGEPGSAVAPADQEAFDRSNGRSWAGFPAGTDLRSLIRTEVGGNEFELFGFRSGSSLCLRIVGRNLNGSPALSCAPLSALKTASAPVVVVQADHPMGLAKSVPADGGYVGAKAQATFGIVADGVKDVELRADDGVHHAIVSENAFLFVAERPKVGTRVRRVFAIDDDGKRLPVPFESAPFGTWDVPTAGQRKPVGPAEVQRKVEGGTIGWLLRREERSDDLPKGGRPQWSFLQWLKFARVITPDPQSHVRVVVGIGNMPGPTFGNRPAGPQLCTFTIMGSGAGGGCDDLEHPFPNGPFTVGGSTGEGGDQFSTLSGLASDAVARLLLYLPDGSTQPIPLHDNVWLTRVARADYPVRIVGYDSNGLIIGIEDFGVEQPRPRPVGKWRTILTVKSGDGVASIRVARSDKGGRCFEIRLPGGGGSSGCLPQTRPRQLPDLNLGIGPTDGWLTGDVANNVATLDIVQVNARVKTVTSAEGFVLARVPGGAGAVKEVIGRDASGAVVGKYRPPTVSPGG